MEDLKDIVDDMIHEKQPDAMAPAEIELRSKLLTTLFILKREPEDDPRIDTYVGMTLSIPMFWFQFAINAIVRSHHWPKVPEVADLFAAARYAAGMHRERYKAGKYLPPTREWPPAGQRHAVNLGELEGVSEASLQIGPGEVAPLLGAGCGS